MAELPKYAWPNNVSSSLFANQTDVTGETTSAISEFHVALNDSSSDRTPVPEYTYNWGVLFLTPIVVFGMAGNILVCMAVSMEKRLQTVTNYFFLSLAITDLLVCFIVMPLSIVSDFFGHWPFNTALCNVFVTSDVLMCTSSILHLCSISLQRYLAIGRPLKSRNKSKCIVIVKIGVIWLMAAMISSPVTVLGINDTSNILVGNRCVLQNDKFIIYGSILAFFIPLVIMVVSYVLTVRLLYKQANLYRNSGSADSGEIMIRRTKCSGGRIRGNGRRFETNGTRPRSRSLSRSDREYREIRRDCRSHTDTTEIGGRFLKIPDIVSHSTSFESLYSNPGRIRTPLSIENIPERSSGGLLHVPDPSRQGSSTESLVSDLSTDEDNNQKYNKNHNFLSAQNGDCRQNKRSVKVTRQLLEKASSILNLPRERTSDKAVSVRTEQKASKVLGFVFVIFIVCWAPFFAVNILSAICKSCSFEPVLVSTFVWFGWISSTINPIIYTVFNSTFKQTFIKLVKCQYGFLQKSFRRRYWNHGTGFQVKDSSDSNAEIPL